MKEKKFKLMLWNAAKEFVDMIYGKIAADELKTDCIFKAFSQVLDDNDIKKEFIDLPISYSLKNNPPPGEEKK
jgi:hypothetical protein